MDVIILAGGLGTRLRSVVHEIPKCLAPIASKADASGWSVPPEPKELAEGSGGTDAPCGYEPCVPSVPFLRYVLEWLEGYSVEHVVFSVGYLREQVISFVQSHEWPFSYDFAVEEQPLGTGGGIRLALEMCHGDHVMVVNGDTFYPVDLSLFSFDKAITLALKPMRHFERYGAVSFDGERVTAFHEKKPCEEGLINGGVYAIDRSRLDLRGLPQRFSFEKEVLEPGAAIGELGGVVSHAYFIDIGVPEDYSRAQWALPAWKAVKRVSSALMETSAQVLFLDRDGVLNRHLPGDYVRKPDMWEWMPGVLEEFSKWAARFRRIVLVSNQRGVGKGVMTDEDLSRIHGMMMADVLEAGGRIDLALYCTALDKDDHRRKPNIGMFEEACGLFPDIDAKRSVMVGDSPSDAAFAENCGMQFILLNPGVVS